MTETDTVPETEQIKEEGDAPAEDEITDVTSSDGEKSEVPDEKTEAPEESKEDTPEDEISSLEIDAKGDTYATLTIEDYLKLKDQVTFAAEGFTISSKGVITAKEGAGGSKPSITLAITAKDNWKIKEVKKDGTAVEGSGTYSVTVAEGNATVTVSTVATYQAKAYGITGTLKVKTSDDATAATTDITAAVASAAATAVTLEKGRAMEFEVAASATAGNRLKVYYITDGSDADDKTEIEAKTTGTGADAKTTYTVDQAVIDALEGSIDIVLLDEAQVAVTVTAGAEVAGIEVEVPDTTEGAAAGAKKWVAYAAGTNNKVFPGETFKFRVKAAANYAIKAAKVNGEALTAGTAMTVTEGTDTQKGTWIPFEVKPTAATDVSIETALDSNACRTLTFKIKDNKAGTATAEITAVKATAEGTETSDADEMKTALGVDSLALAENTPLSVLKSAVSIKVTVTASQGYALTKDGSETTPQATRVYTLTGDALRDETVVEVATEEAGSAAANFFKLTLAKLDEADVITNPRVTEVTDRVVKKGDADNVYYSVAEGVQTIALKVDVVEGNEVSVSGAAAKSITPGTPASGKVTYDIVLLASTLTAGGTDSFAGATAVTITPAALTYSVAESDDCSDAGYTIDYKKKDNKVQNAEFAAYDPDTDGALAYNNALKAIIKPAENYTLEEVSYTMGGDPVPVTIEWDDSDSENEFEFAELNIAKVTDDVEITVKTKLDAVKLGALQEVTNGAGGITFGDVESDSDEIYQVDYNGKYVVDVQENGVSVVDPKNVSVVVKNASGAAVAMTTPLVTSQENETRRSINLASKNLAGQEITAEVSYKGELVGTYIMQVGKKTTELSVNGGQAITQSVDSVAYYPIVTNGAVPTTATVTDLDDGDLSDKVSVAIVGGKLKVTIAPAKQSDIATRTTTGTGESQTTTWTDKKAVIKVTSPDDGDIYDEVEISATPLFAEDAVPTLTVDSAADVLMNVTVGTGAVQKPYSGKFEYTVVATPTAGTTEAPIPDALRNGATTKTWAATKDTNVSGAVVVANSENLGEGATWTYKLTATVVYKDAAGNTIQTLTLDGDKAVNGSTDVPVFEDALKLKKTKNTTFYTGWSGELEIATPVWKNGKYKVLDENATIIDKTNGNLNDYVEIKNGNVVLTSVPSWVKTGKHTIEVMATRNETGKDTGMGSEHTSYAARATIAINVVQGINSLSVSTPSYVIYKDAKKKSATMKLGLVYNPSHGSYKGNKWVPYAPKTKKVTWDIYGLDSYGNIMKNEDGSPVESAYIKQYVTIKNGTITVKGFTTDERHEKNNHFAVRVKAADFANNDVEDWIDDIMVSTDKMTIGKVALVQYNGETGKYKVVALQDGNKVQAVKAKDVNGAFVLAAGANSNAAVGSEYTYNQLWSRMDLQDPNNAKVTANNKIAAIDWKSNGYLYDGVNYEQWPYLYLNGTNKKIKITVTANDGGKAKSVLPLSLEYTDTEGKDLSIDVGTSYGAKDVYEAKKVEKTGAEKDFTVDGAAVLYVTLKVGDKNDETSTNFGVAANSFTNYKLTVKGGKKLSDAGGRARIVTTSEVTTITLTNPNVDKSKKEKAKVYTYKLTNKAYAKTLNKAPKITVKGQLYQYAAADEQSVTMTALNGKESVGDLYARVEADWSALGSNVTKNSAIYGFDNKIDSGTAGGSHIFKINKDTGVIDLKFDDTNSYDGFVPGSYKVKVSVGTGATDAQFKATYLPATATIKVVRNKAFTFKPTTSYTINKVDGGAILGGKSNLKDNEIRMTFDELQNENKKGVINKFTHYFKVEQDAVSGTYRLTLNEDDYLVQQMLFEPKMNGTEPAKDAAGNVIYDTTKPKANPVITIPKEHLTGYVHYNVWTNKGYYTNVDSISGYAKIKVKIAAEPKAGKQAKASQKYVPQAAEVKLAKDSKTEVNLKVNGAYVSAAYAIIDESKAKSNAAELALDGAGVNADGQLTFKAASALTEGKKYSTNLLVVPNNSWYARIIAAAPAQAPAAAQADAESTTTQTKTDLIKLYGIPVKITITATANAKTTEKMAPAVDPTPGEDEVALEQAKTLVENWLATLSGTGDNLQTWLKNGTTKADLTAKANANAAIAASGWTVAITDPATLTGATANAAASAATVKYKLTKDGETSEELIATATITLPAGAIAADALKDLIEALSITVSAGDNATTIQGAVTSALTAMEGKTNIDNYYTIEVGEVSGITGSSNTEAASSDNVIVAVSITPKDGSTVVTTNVTKAVS